MIKYFVIHFGSLVKLFGLALQQKIVQSPKQSWLALPVTGKFTDFPVCAIRNIFIRKLSHLTISSPFIVINQKMHKKPQ